MLKKRRTTTTQRNNKSTRRRRFGGIFLLGVRFVFGAIACIVACYQLWWTYSVGKTTDDNYFKQLSDDLESYYMNRFKDDNALSSIKLLQQQTTSTSNNSNNKLPSSMNRSSSDGDRYYVHSSFICGGCNHARVSRGGMYCVEKIKQVMQRNRNLTRRQAHEQIGQDPNLQQCSMCHPDKCAETNGTKYWYFDMAAPKIDAAVSHYLPSIPKSWRLPPDTPNVTKYLQEEWTKQKTVQVLFEYNPTLIALTPKMMEQLDVSSSSSSGLKHPACYLASYRVTSENGCFPDDDDGMFVGDPDQAWQLTQMQNYLGLALLDKNLDMISGSDIVLDIETELHLRFHESKAKKQTGFGKRLVDFRLFAFDDTIYLNMNGPPVYVTSITIATPTKKKPYHPVHVRKETILDSSSTAASSSDGGGIKLPNLVGDGLEVTLGHDLNTVWGVPKGKNFPFFRVPGVVGRNDEVLVELNPLGPHIVQRIRPEQMEIVEDRVIHGFLWPNLNFLPGRLSKEEPQYRINQRGVAVVGTQSISEKEPKPSFRTVDEIWFPSPIFTGPRGGACCIHLEKRFYADFPSYKDNDEFLLVGVAHVKVPHRPWRNRAPPDALLDQPVHQYVSFFYAFAPIAPYTTRARSGLFCLPFPEENEGSPYTPLTLRRKLNFKRQEFDCPGISYVSGITEKAGADSSSVIVSYGINDCTSRMVEIHKAEIARLLFTNLE